MAEVVEDGPGWITPLSKALVLTWWREERMQENTYTSPYK